MPVAERIRGTIRQFPIFRDLPRETLVIAIISGFVALGFGIVAPSIPIFARTMGVGVFAASAVISAFALMRFVSSPAAGVGVNRFGERRVLALGLIIVAVSSLLAGLAQTYWWLLVMRALGGIGSSMFTVSSMALVLRTAGPAQRGRASGAVQAGFLLGGVAGPAIGGLIVGISIRAPFFFYAATLTVATVVCLTMLREPVPTGSVDEPTDGTPRMPDVAGSAEAGRPSTTGLDNTASIDEAHAVQAVEMAQAADAGERVPLLDEGTAPGGTPVAGDPDGPGDPSLRDALRNRAYWAALAVNLGNGFSIFGLRSALIPLFVVEALRQKPSYVGFGFLVAAGVQAVMLLPAGRMSDLRGRRPAMIIGATAGTLGLLILVVRETLPWYFAAMVVLGVSAAFLGSAPTAVVGDISGGRPGGPMVALYQMTSDLGAIVGPLVAGLLLQAFGFAAAFSVGAVVAVFGLVMSLLMPETHHLPSASVERGSVER